MQTELVVKTWKVEVRDEKPVIVGTYAVMLGKKEIASQSFNENYSTCAIEFPKEVRDEVYSLNQAIKNAITESF